MGLKSVYPLPLSCRHLFGSDDADTDVRAFCAGLKYPVGATGNYIARMALVWQ